MKVKFPIVRTVVYNAHSYKKVLNQGDIVNCYFCGTPITVDKNTVVQDENGMQFLCCSGPNCLKKVSVLYYFDKVTNIEKKPVKKRLKKRNKEEDVARWFM